MNTLQRANEQVQRIVSQHFCDMSQKRSSQRLEKFQEESIYNSTNPYPNWENFVHQNDKFYSTTISDSNNNFVVLQTNKSNLKKKFSTKTMPTSVENFRDFK